MSETLHDCPICGRKNFTAAGLTHHRCRPMEANQKSEIVNHKSRKRCHSDPLDLRPHPLLDSQPMLDPEGDEFKRLRDLITEYGIDESLKITEEGLIADGRHRWLIARDLWKRNPDWRARYPNGIPCEIVDEADVPMIAIRSLVGRRHYTDTQRAYVICPLIPQAFEEARIRRLANITRSPVTHMYATPRVQTLEEWAAQIGVSVRLLQQARKLREVFARHPEPRTLTDRDGVIEKDVTFEEFFESRLLADHGDHKPYGMGGILAGIKATLVIEDLEARGKHHDGGRPRSDQVEKQLNLFNQVVDDGVQRWKYWENLDAECQEQHWQHVSVKAAALEPERCEQLAEYYLKLSRVFNKVARKAAA